MFSAIILGICNALFMGITMAYGAWYSMNAKNEDSLGTAMPLLLMLPRFFAVLGSLALGVYFLEWGTGPVVGFVSIIGGLWLLLVTAEIIYIQMKLRGRIYEKIEVEEISRKPVPIRYRTISDNALVAYEARKRTQF